ncbi:uncharacterized protein C2orf42 homolog isoform X3 [Cololabis saira]|uniref:uncharacterized protein C2orf42 homolog isoform X3 n=1 Tax=Cololabis saira TaxID=129043 RepID=UPI002AD36CE9|nr:uncharacterized protein C2orf42 homolog isoform X3 [Cololabis saira]
MDNGVTVSSSSSIISSASSQTPTTKATLAAKRDCKKSASTTPSFLSNLGRATLRGIRRCPQCGVYNGTRGLSCKNKACGVSLRNASATGKISKKCAVEVVRVITDSEERGEKEQEGGVVLGVGSSGGAQVFSVCHRGRGATATQWGFVELVPTDTAIATGDGATLLTRINLGRCFLPSCRQGQRSNQRESESAAGKQSSDSLCIHIKQAIECQKQATPLTFKSSVLEGLQASIQAREELWRLATESPGPLVQRVSKDTLVVKCHADSHHPLGLLHFTVGTAGPHESAKGEKSVFHCTCQVSTRRNRPGVDGGGLGSSHPPSSSGMPQLCLHFYACVCAFASNEKLAAEFAAFIGYADSGNAQVVDEHTVTMGFHQWLASVTERIHQTMHFQFDGKPQPLVYHLPQEFFNALQQRLSLGSKKRRLPNFTTVVKNDGLPLGSFSKYTWHITNLLQVKRVFDTPELPLEVTQSFVKNGDGSYSRFHCPEPEPELLEGSRMERPQAIRPMELRTFLKVGPGTTEQKEASPFVMEWIPDVLPRSQMGELRISFEFGHQQSGQLESPEKTGVAERGGRSKSDCTQTRVTKAPEIVQVVV